MLNIDYSILEKGYSIYKAETGAYYGMEKDEVNRLHRALKGKPLMDL